MIWQQQQQQQLQHLKVLSQAGRVGATTSGGIKIYDYVRSSSLGSSRNRSDGGSSVTRCVLPGCI
jgi:hypothetical protein